MSRSQPNLLEDAKNYEPSESTVQFCRDFIEFPKRNSHNPNGETLCDDLSGTFTIEAIRMAIKG